MKAAQHSPDDYLEAWDRRRLSDLVAFEKGRVVTCVPNPDVGNVPYIGADSFGGSFKQFTRDPAAVTCNASDVLMLWDGERSGFCATGLSGAIGSTVARVRPKSGTNSRFLYHQLTRHFAWIQARRTGTGVPHVPKDLGSTLIIVRPLSEGEQSHIADVLDTTDSAIAKTEEVVAKLRQLRSGLLHELLSRGLNEHGQLRDPVAKPEQFQDSPKGLIPRGWDVCLLDEVSIRGSGHTPNKDVPSYWNGGIKWVSLADSDRLDRIYISETDKQISEDGIANSSAVKHPPGTVILSRDAGIGKSAVLADEMAVSQHFIAWRCGKRVHNLYLYYWLQHNKRAFEAIAMGSTIKTIGLSYFKRLRIAVPARWEQKAVSERMLQVEATIDAAQWEMAKLRMMKTGLMVDLLTGGVRVSADQIEQGIRR